MSLLAAAALLQGCSSRTEEAAPSVASSIAPEVSAYDFQIGAFAATALRDGTVEFPNDNQVFGVGRTPEEVASVLEGAGLPTDKLQLGLDPLLVEIADRVLLFDTGAGSNFGDSAGHLAASMTSAGVDPASVTDIFISHIHGDHVGGLVDADDAPVFANATIHMSRPEWEFLKSQTEESAKQLGIGNFGALLSAVAPNIEPFEPDAQIVPGVVQAVQIKGHTPGHSAYLISSETASLLYIGDAMHHYVVSVQHPEWAIAFDADQQTGIDSRKTLLEQAALQGQRIYAVHFPFPGLGMIEKNGSGFAWKAE